MSEFKLPNFDQIGIVVRDIEKAINLLSSILDFRVNLNIVEQTSNVVYKGNEVSFKMKKIMQKFDGKQLEIVEVIESTGNHLYLDYLQEGKEGLHHLGIYTKNIDTILDHYKKNFGIEVIQRGEAGKVNFFYLDTRDVLGFYLELIVF
ncbi:MAG: VOC family protein [Candidatus Hodarchaeales archaeon]|jgi:catechol 2,3-dioxygenase-like lactoylglutathione lyase family enzyme